MYIDGVNLKLSTGELTATYTTPVRDVSYVAAFSIAIDAITSITTSLAFDSEGSRKFDDSTTLRFVGEETAGALTFEIRISEDDIVWSSWTPFRKGDFYCRYFQLRMTMTREATDVDLLCSQFDYSADLPDVDEFSDGVVTISDADAGITVTFSKTYHEVPVVALDIASGNASYYKVTNLDTTDFDIHLYDIAGAKQTGTFNWKSHGI